MSERRWRLHDGGVVCDACQEPVGPPTWDEGCACAGPITRFEAGVLDVLKLYWETALSEHPTDCPTCGNPWEYPAVRKCADPFHASVAIGSPAEEPPE